MSSAVEQGGAVMLQQGQVFKLTSKDRDGTPFWAYRYRTGGRDARRVQQGGFATEDDAWGALERVLERLRRASSAAKALTLAELVEEYLAQHEAARVTLEKLHWLLTRAVAEFGDRRLDELRSHEIAAWRMTIPAGYRFEATQALRQVLARAVIWGMLDVNPAKQGVENPQRRRTEKRPFESWDELEALAEKLGSRFGPMVVFAAATGLRPGEWVALERRDIDYDLRVAYVRRAFSKGRLKVTKTEASVRAVPLQGIALAALDRLPSGAPNELLFQRLAAVTSICITSAPATGDRLRQQLGSTRCGASTIFGIPSRPSRSVPASPPSTSPATWAPA
jgi:integrase